MKTFSCILVASACGAVLTAAAPLQAPQHHASVVDMIPADFKLVWSDEFDTPGLPDERNWSYDTEANNSGWYNNELQYYAVRRKANAEISGGTLRITARKEALSSEPDHGGQRYSSARLISRGKRDVTYGLFDIRAKLPCGQGTWPAIWMLGTSGGWPDAGEIDIMEHVGKTPQTIFGTIHNRSTAGTSGNGGSTMLSDACTAFHTYRAEWSKGRIILSVDGQAFHVYRNARSGSAQWPFDKPMYLLLNLAIGGDMAGAVDERIFPRTFEIDYVRVYKKL